MPGSFQVLSPTDTASDATTKNQPPDIDIMVFHTRPGVANGTSSRQNRCQALRWKLSAASARSAGHRAQRLVQAERHVPGLAGEDREDRRQFQPHHLAGEQVHEEHDGEGEEPQDRHRLQDVQHRDQHQPGPPAFRGGGAVGEGEQQRGDQRGEHPQRGAHGVVRQVDRVEADLDGARRDRGEGAARHLGDSRPARRTRTRWRRRPTRSASAGP